MSADIDRDPHHQINKALCPSPRGGIAGLWRRASARAAFSREQRHRERRGASSSRGGGGGKASRLGSFASSPQRPDTSSLPRPVTARAGSSSSAGRLLSSRGPLFPSLAATSLRKKSSSRSSSRSNNRIAAKRGDKDEENPKRSGSPLSRWAQLTAREKAVIATFFALAILFGPRLLVLSLVSLEAAATGALLAAERALGAAFLTSFVWLAGAAALLLAGLLVYFLILEEERLEDSDEE